jgi:hypothetical protein
MRPIERRTLQAKKDAMTAVYLIAAFILVFAALNLIEKGRID